MKKQDKVLCAVMTMAVFCLLVIIFPSFFPAWLVASAKVLLTFIQ